MKVTVHLLAHARPVYCRITARVEHVQEDL